MIPATNSQTALRSDWHDTSFSAGVVADAPNESYLEPQAWGSAVIE